MKSLRITLILLSFTYSCVNGFSYPSLFQRLEPHPTSLQRISPPRFGCDKDPSTLKKHKHFSPLVQRKLSNKNVHDNVSRKAIPSSFSSSKIIKTRMIQIAWKLCTNIALGLCIFSLYSRPAMAASSASSSADFVPTPLQPGGIRPYFRDSDGIKVWWKDLPDYIRKNVAHYYEPCLFTIPKDSSKSMQFAVAVKETISAILFFMRNMGKYLVQYGLFMGFFAFTAKMGRGGGGSGRMFGETGTKDGMGISTQDSLEARPYWDQSQVTFDTFNVTSPFVGKIVSNKKIAGSKAQGETHQLIIEHNGNFRFWEGQSIGVVPPDSTEHEISQFAIPTYAIASSRYGDDKRAKTLSICVSVKAEANESNGFNNYLCSMKKGEEIKITGPVGKRAMLFPEEEPTTDFIMVGTGTGISRFRGFIRRLFVENTRVSYAYKGKFWLFSGAASKDTMLYNKDMLALCKEYPDQFRYDCTFSQEDDANDKHNTEEMLISDKVREHSDEVFSKLDKGAIIFFNDKLEEGVVSNVEKMLKETALAKGIEFDEWFQRLVDFNQWQIA